MSKYFSISFNNININGDRDSCSISITRRNSCSNWIEYYSVSRTNKGNVRVMFPTSGVQDWCNVPMDGIIINCDYNRHNLKVLAQIFEQGLLGEANLPIIGRIKKFWATEESRQGWPIPVLREKILRVSKKG